MAILSQMLRYFSSIVCNPISVTCWPRMAVFACLTAAGAGAAVGLGVLDRLAKDVVSTAVQYTPRVTI